MSTREVRRMLEKHCQRADLDQAVSPHDLRHTFGSRLVERDVPTRTVQVLMGHVRLSSTQRYLHANAEQLAAAVGPRFYTDRGRRVNACFRSRVACAKIGVRS